MDGWIDGWVDSRVVDHRVEILGMKIGFDRNYLSIYSYDVWVQYHLPKHVSDICVYLLYVIMYVTIY